MTILVTGSNGFVGRHVKEAFKRHGHEGVFYPSSRECDLLELTSMMSYFERVKPDTVVHLAAVCGGIGMNKKRPADLTHLNLKMASNLFDAVYKFDIEYVYALGSVCSYPENCPTPFKEEDFWNGYPESTNAGYSMSKKALYMLQTEYRKQYGTKGAHLVPVNMFGEHDGFDLENSHVIPAMIRKFLEAKESGSRVVNCWGTGKATREFFYAGDCAEAIVQAVTQKLDYDGPINLGTGKEISINNLAGLIAELTGFDGDICFTGEVSDGQPRRQLDVSRAKEVLGFEAQTNLVTGLKKTIKWYKEEK